MSTLGTILDVFVNESSRTVTIMDRHGSHVPAHRRRWEMPLDDPVHCPVMSMYDHVRRYYLLTDDEVDQVKSGLLRLRDTLDQIRESLK